MKVLLVHKWNIYTANLSRGSKTGFIENGEFCSARPANLYSDLKLSAGFALAALIA
jgi:hypothetical protein